MKYNYKIRFFNPAKGYLKIKKEIDSEVQRVLATGDLILRSDVEKFEENLAKFVGTKYAIGVNSGTDALFLSLKYADIGTGDEVITVGHTFHATVEAIYWNDAKPVLIDVGDDSLMDVTKIEEAITKNTKAIVPVHLMGDVCNMSEIMKIAKKYGLIVVEDACQALGGQFDGKKAGSWGLSGCFSFYPAKILGAMGDAGAITTNDVKMAKELKDMRNHYKYNPGKYGFNSRLDNLQASILNAKIEYLPEMISQREAIAKFYDSMLEGIGDIKLPSRREGRVYQDYVIKTSERDKLAEYLGKKGIETMKNDYHFPINLLKSGKTIKLESQTLRLPCNDILEISEVYEVIKVIRKFYARC